MKACIAKTYRTVGTVDDKETTGTSLASGTCFDAARAGAALSGGEVVTEDCLFEAPLFPELKNWRISIPTVGF